MQPCLKPHWSPFAKTNQRRSVKTYLYQPDGRSQLVTGHTFSATTPALTDSLFVIHPLSIKFIHNSPRFAFTKYLPDAVVERAASRIRPFYISKITGIESPATGQKKIEGYLYGLGGTPKELMRPEPGPIYRQLIYCARMAERRGARLDGPGAFTSVVGDAALPSRKIRHRYYVGQQPHRCHVGNGQTGIGTDGHLAGRFAPGYVMVIGATGSLALFARAYWHRPSQYHARAPRPEKLIALKRTIEEETPDAHDD